MSIETMQLMQIVGKKKLMNRVLRAAVINGTLHVIDALDEINTNKVKIEEDSDTIDSLIEQRTLKRYAEQRDFTKDEELLKSLTDLFLIEPKLYEEYIAYDYNYERTIGRLTYAKQNVQPVFEAAEKIEAEIAVKKKRIENLNYLTSLDSNIDGLLNMSNLLVDVIIVSKENYKKLKLNFENISAVVLHINDEKDNVVLLTATIASLREDFYRICESLNYTKVDIPTGYSGTAREVISQIKGEIKQLEDDLSALRGSIREFEANYTQIIKQALTMIEIEKRAEEIKRHAAIGRSLFCVYGFVPKRDAARLQNEITNDFGVEVSVAVEDVEDRKTGVEPPSKVRTSRFCKPFNFMIRMYGTPSYNELDPTPFFTFSYMLLFGAMFGDLGQGIVILLGGLIVAKKMKQEEFGGILMRLGLSSSIFGLLYGSVFGDEEIIRPLVLRPMENIMQILMYAVVLGFVLLSIAYIYGLLNFKRRKDIEEGIFSKEGLVGFLFFITFAAMVANVLLKFVNWPMSVFLIILGVLLLITVFKQPLANLVERKDKLYEGSKVDYFLEMGFGSIETILSVLSNLISFIRVGAFALNHVGLYMAFAAMATMFSSRVGSTAMLVVGNIVIIGMEGLIVFIQSMRLEYYELFSKYYTGEGIEYCPVSLNN